ncbi:MAG TPA: tetratricopeptide repeat protein [Burkholderiales bacterium]|nr:tetratricopeptide repeat protein [Burkholderiales bacterium]
MADQRAHPKPQEIESLLRQARAAHGRGATLQAELLYAQVLQDAPEHAVAHHLIGVLKFQRGAAEEGLAHFDSALRARPRFAEAYNSRGNALLGLGRVEEALRAYESGLAVRRDDADLLANRGAALQALGRHAEAVESYRRALARRPQDAPLQTDLGISLRALDRDEEALACFERALRADPAYAEALTNRGNLLLARGQLDVALASHRQAVALRPDNAQMQLNLAVAELASGDWESGWRSYAHRDLDREPSGARREFSAPRWQGAEPLEGRTLLAHAEQGFGDTLMFARYLPLLAARGARVVLEVQPRLKSLFAGIAGVVHLAARGEPLPAYDLHCALPDLPGAFGTRPENVPPPLLLAPAPPLADKWRARLAELPRPRLGIVWSGNPAYGKDRSRSISLERLAAALPPAGVAAVSLQKDASEEEVALLGRLGIRHTGPDQQDFGDAAALVGEMDLVLSIDSSVPHLAGSLGKPVWLLLAHAPDWRWMRGREDSVWYPGHRLYRAAQPGTQGTDELLQRVGAELRTRFRAEK